MSPVRFVNAPANFDSARSAINQVLAFSGHSLGEDGRLRPIDKVAGTLNQAQEAAGKLRTELSRRGVHADVLKFCRPELVQGNYFHAVFEATKSVADKIRMKAEITGDGGDLVDRAFGIGKNGMPVVAFNGLRDDTERSEHNGLMNLMKGTFGAFRNVTAHAPKVYWKMSEQDALDLLTIASYLHRRLDSSFRTPRPV